MEYGEDLLFQVERRYLYEETVRIAGFWRLAEMYFRHLSGTKNVTFRLQYSVSVCVVCDLT